MGLNPLIAARSYIFHVFFILPQESTQEMNILFLIHGLCVCLCFWCVSSCLSVLKISPSPSKFYFWETCSQRITSFMPCHVFSVSTRGQQGAVVCLFLLLLKTITWLCCFFCIQQHWQHAGPTAPWVMNEPSFITINQWAKPINCQARDNFVFVRMTDCSTVQMHQTAAAGCEKAGLNESWTAFIYVLKMNNF